VISGTPTTVGDYTFKIQVTDGSRKDSETYTLSVVEPLKITHAATAGEVGIPFEVTPTATGGRPAYVWSVEGTLPAGWRSIPHRRDRRQADRGRLLRGQAVGQGQPRSHADSDVNLIVATKLAITKRPLKGAKAARLTRRSSLRAAVSSPCMEPARRPPGFLPKGLKLNRKTGEISGTPTSRARTTCGCRSSTSSAPRPPRPTS